METVADFILGGSKVTADGDCSNEMEPTTTTCNNIEESQKHKIEQKKADSKEHILYASIYIKFNT